MEVQSAAGNLSGFSRQEQFEHGVISKHFWRKLQSTRPCAASNFNECASGVVQAEAATEVACHNSNKPLFLSLQPIRDEHPTQHVSAHGPHGYLIRDNEPEALLAR